MIEPVADRLGIPVHRIHANRLLFDEAHGAYTGFDEREPTSRDGGKRVVVEQLIQAHGYGPVGTSYTTAVSRHL
jgi:phosphoserine phosphatase